jgi:SH3 domain protein
MLGLCLALGLLGSQASAAERAWIKGEVRLNLRSGPGTNYRILDGVKTGDVLTVLNRKESWTEVRTEEGKSGWIPAGYLDTTPPPTIRLEQLETERVQLREQLEKLDGEAQELRSTNETLSASDSEQTNEINRLTRENLELRAGARWPEWITGALILSTGMVLGALLSRLSGRGRRQRIRL